VAERAAAALSRLEVDTSVLAEILASLVTRSS